MIRASTPSGVVIIFSEAEREQCGFVTLSTNEYVDEMPTDNPTVKIHLPKAFSQADVWGTDRSVTLVGSPDDVVKALYDADLLPTDSAVFDLVPFQEGKQQERIKKEINRAQIVDKSLDGADPRPLMDLTGHPVVALLPGTPGSA